MQKWIVGLVVMSLSSNAVAQAGPVGGTGRYVIVHSPHVQRDTVLLDTVTGKTWMATQYTSREGEPIVWVPMTRTDNSAEMEQFVREYPRKASSNQ